MRVLRAALVLIVALTYSTLTAAIDFSNPAFAQTGGETSIPFGHYEFCKSLPDECLSNEAPVAVVVLSDGLWKQLATINKDFNAAVAPVSDLDQYKVVERWTYPGIAGDCEDYALAKRRALIEAGWPVSILLIAVVQQYSGEGHAVLMVRTDRGDLVLDNRDGDIHVWNETPYSYVKRQSQAGPGQWVAISDDRPLTTASVHAR